MVRGEFITDAKVEIISLSIRRLQSNFKKKVEHAYTYKEKAIGRNPELAPKIGSRSFPNSVKQPSFYAYKTLNHSGTFADEIKNTEANFEKHLENIRRINEANRLINEFRQNSTASSSFNEIAKSLFIQTASNLFQGRRSGSSMTPKKEILPTGYQISFCDTCLSGCNLRPVLYPIEFEAVAKLVHKCNPKNLFTGQNGEEILKKKRQLKDFLRNFLSEVTGSRIGQKGAYLKGAKTISACVLRRNTNKMEASSK